MPMARKEKWLVIVLIAVALATYFVVFLMPPTRGAATTRPELRASIGR